MRLAVILILAACGGAKPAPPKPQPLDAKGLARVIHEDFTRLVDIAQRLRGKCKETIAELQPHVATMQNHHVEVERLLQDEQQATALKQELAAYAKQLPAKVEQVANDLAATHAACTKECADRCGTECAQPCSERYQLERVIADMPTY